MTSLTSPISSNARVVPLSLPLDSPNLRVLKSLRQHAAQLVARQESLKKLDVQLMDLPDEPRWNALVPVSPASKLGFARGQITNTITVLVKLGGGEEGANDGYWVEYTAKQARGVAERKKAAIQNKLEKVQAAIQDAEASLSTEMGYTGGRLNEKNELVNEEGLPFVDIQEFEEDEELISQPVTTANSVKSTQGSPTPASPKVATEQAKVLSNGIASLQSVTPDSTKAQESSLRSKVVEKKVTFSDETKTEDAGEGIPTITSPAVASGSTTTTSLSAQPVKQAVFERPMKTAIVEKESTKPPPVLTAAERSARRYDPLGEAETYDGVEANRRKVNLSAYLPKSLRDNAISRQNRGDLKGKGRAEDEGDIIVAPDDEDEGEEHEQDEEEYDEDSDGLYEYDESDEDDEDNVHIDDLMAMREAALEYYAKRHNLGAGAGTGPLGGEKGPDEYEEPGSSHGLDTGLPFVATYDDDGSGGRQPSRFRTGRLQSARMIIPDIQPGSVDIDSSILPGDSLGPFEDSRKSETGEANLAEDFTGMSKEEVETFLRYVHALEKGEDLDSLKVIPATADGAQAEERESLGPMPPTIKQSTRPQVVQEKPAAAKEAVVERSTPVSATPQEKEVKPAAPEPEKPKRVSRFRAAKADTA